MTSYPAPPWHLHGRSISILRLVEIDRVRDAIPPELRIVAVAPGRTLAVLYCARYGSGSTLSYHELIVASALVRARRAIAFWISEIYVDDPVSQAGGHGIWGLPKQQARFDWDAENGLAAIEYGGAPITTVEWQPARVSMPVPVWLPIMSRLESRLLMFHAQGRCTLALVRGSLTSPAHSRLASLGFDRANHIACASNLRLTIEAPKEQART